MGSPQTVISYTNRDRRYWRTVQQVPTEFPKDGQQLPGVLSGLDLADAPPAVAVRGISDHAFTGHRCLIDAPQTIWSSAWP